MTESAYSRYSRWWLGKRVRNADMGSERPFKKVVRIELIGPPSFVYGDVELHYEDGTSEYVRPTSRNAFKPRKKDVEVHPDDRD